MDRVELLCNILYETENIPPLPFRSLVYYEIQLLEYGEGPLTSCGKFTISPEPYAAL